MSDPFRNELEAAHAKIDHLEREKAQLEGAGARAEALEAQNRALQEQLAEARGLPRPQAAGNRNRVALFAVLGAATALVVAGAVTSMLLFSTSAEQSAQVQVQAKPAEPMVASEPDLAQAPQPAEVATREPLQRDDDPRLALGRDVSVRAGKAAATCIQAHPRAAKPVTVMLHLDIAKSGAVTAARGEGAEPMRSCMATQAKAWKLAESDHTTSLTIPVVVDDGSKTTTVVTPRGAVHTTTTVVKRQRGASQATTTVIDSR